MKKIVPSESQFERVDDCSWPYIVILLGGVPKRSLPLRVTLDSRERSTYVVDKGMCGTEHERRGKRAKVSRS
jgi:hypothetical protein